MLWWIFSYILSMLFGLFSQDKHCWVKGYMHVSSGCQTARKELQIYCYIQDKLSLCPSVCCTASLVWLQHLHKATALKFVLQWSSLCLRILHIRGVKSSSEGNVYIRNLDRVVFILESRALQAAVKWWHSMCWYFAVSGTWSQAMILSYLRWVTEEVVFLWGKLTDSSTTCIQLHPGLVLRRPEQCPWYVIKKLWSRFLWLVIK